MAGNRTLKLSILADVDDLNKKLKQANGDVDTSSNKLSEFGKKAGVAFAAAAAAAGVMAIKIGVDAVKAASDLSETISKVGVLFGETSKDIEKFADGAASSLGQTKQQALNAAATFATFGKAAGLSGQDLSKFSIDFVKLSSDLASFNNTSPEQAINAIGSALRGEAEPLRAYGVLLDDASLRQEALALGIVNTTKNALTPQQKVLAAQALIYKQTGAAQGDFERTSDGLANKTRILTAQLENAKVTIGDALLPIVLELATFFSDKVIPIVQSVADAFGSNKDKTAGVNGILTTLVDTISGLVIPIFNGMKTAFDKIKATIIENKDEFQAFFDVIKAAAPIIGTVIGKAFEVIGNIASVVLNLISNVLAAIKPLLNTAIDGINLVIRGLNLIKVGNDIPYLTKIGSTGTSATAGISVPTASLPSGFKPAGSSTGSTGSTGSVTPTTTTSNGSTGIAGVSSAVASVTSIGSFNAGSFRAAESASMAPVYNINVTGALDKEGVARQIVEIINESSYRGGGGAGSALIA
jgi:phage-related protein